MTSFDPAAEFDRQHETRVAKGYPKLAGLTGAQFAQRLAPLRAVAAQSAWMDAPTRGWVPFLLVVGGGYGTVADRMALTTLAFGSAPGFVDRLFGPGGIEVFRPSVQLPTGGAYLLTGVERGERFANRAPEAALPTIEGRGRTPLTVDEGVALLTQYPYLLQHNKCFSLAGSSAGDRRVPALWIARHAPKLGWCWRGAPHAWLGVASAAERLGAGVLHPV